jgi:hypothetical protein
MKENKEKYLNKSINLIQILIQTQMKKIRGDQLKNNRMKKILKMNGV